MLDTSYVPIKIGHGLDIGNMRKPLKVAPGKWVKFEHYELRNGCIAPAPGVRMRTYNLTALRNRPYQSLREIVPSASSMNLPAQRPAVVEAAISWVNQYGLLGIFHHRIREFTRWPRWERTTFADHKRRNHFQARQDTFIHTAAGWYNGTTRLPLVDCTDPACLDAALDQERLPADCVRPSALVSDIMPGAIATAPLGGDFARFFPDVATEDRETYAYPQPDTHDFWQAYGEPLTQFLKAAWLFSSALDAITRPKHRLAPQRGATALTQLAAACSTPALVPLPDGTFDRRWVAGSLLSALALLAIDDIAKGALHQCEKCNTLFTTDAYQGLYCSPRCRWAAQKQRYRLRLREAPPRHKRKKGR